MSSPTSTTENPSSQSDSLAFLSFSIGPVQPFIAAARSLRDLWIGSYLLSYLTTQAMKPIVEAHGREAVISPALDANPFWQTWGTEEPTARTGWQIPCLPNRFLAQVPAEQAERLAEQSREAASRAWQKIAEAVHEVFQGELDNRSVEYRENWDQLWQSQIDSFFDLRTAVLPWEAYPEETIQQLGITAAESLWQRRWELAIRLAESQRSVRHFPQYELGPQRVPGKCSLLGTYEQMGPATLNESATFWQEVSEKCRWSGFRFSPRERFCAISIVKRLAWRAFFATALDKDVRETRLADTATVAARLWLNQAQIGPEQQREWSGQWLHWPQRDFGQDEDEDSVPQAVWDQITPAKQKLGSPPTYYAVLVLDGDRMGEQLRGDQAHQQHVSSLLARFATTTVPKVVNNHDGDLIYAGGDDVLALLPAKRALGCAQALAKAFGELDFGTNVRPTVSVGIAVVHYKEDLRFALGKARQAESQAKQAGRNLLQLAICRRSGEHVMTPCPWECLGAMEQLIAAFSNGASDRWAYHLAADVETLTFFNDVEVYRSMLRRQLGRAEQRTREQIGEFLEKAWENYSQALSSRQGAARSVGERFRAFLNLCQSASFLTRGRD